jgi:dihydrofolate reductase
MRKIIVGAFLSLDGVMQAPGGPVEDPTGGFEFGGWTTSYGDEAVGQFMGYLTDSPYDLLLGRKTYEIFAAYWPFMENDPIADAFNGVTKYVATHSDEAFTWANTTPLRGDDVIDQIKKLKLGDGPRLVTQGSSVLLQTLFTNDLVDEFRLLTYPLILGRGKRLFEGDAKPTGLKLVSSKVSGTGVVMSVYERGGEIKTGTYEMQAPSEAELARRERMKREG